MKKEIGIVLLLWFCALAAFAQVSEDASFTNPLEVGDKALLSFNTATESVVMVYAQNLEEISFPVGRAGHEHSATLTTKFWVADTEFTNAQAVAVLQWAYDSQRIVEISGVHNEVNASVVRYGSQVLIPFAVEHSRLIYNDGKFAVEKGFENHPLVEVTWYGAIMLCNWLTEMRDGSAENLVYSGITEEWIYTEVEENLSNKGYRLPTFDEWEYVARYLGKTEPKTGGGLDSDRLSGDDNAEWTDGYYWTPGTYASGANSEGLPGSFSTAMNPGLRETSRVAVFRNYGSGSLPRMAAPVKSLGPESANYLGLYDVSGNASEWGFNSDLHEIRSRGGGWLSGAYQLQLGAIFRYAPIYGDRNAGFRLFRTAD